ncbi:hypothetical protein PYW07_009845 [Mythimna separata]|uniref:Cytochrome P450 n=1 Tax=Mythimna separata TaxID=271217 RepID=A0AAD7YHG2_MYTSE|nr:hypothetical protein PYW07_009845 [Mythimna separata]
MFTVVLLCIACFAYWCWCRQRAKTAEPPSMPGAWPLVGHIPLFFRNGCMITDPDDCNTIATTCIEKDPIYEFAKPWLGESLFTSRYEVWKNDYKLLNPAFSQTILNTFMDVFNSESRKLVKEFEKHAEKGPFDHFTYLRHNALDIICRTKFKPFVDILLELSVEKGAFNDEQIRAQVDLMLAGGHETTPNALLFTMVLLGSHPVVQEKVFSEIQEVLGGDRDVDKMDLSRLQYLEAVVKESLRLFTVVPQIARKLERDVKLSKTFAMMSMKTTLAHVVRSYRIKADHTKMRLKYVAMLKPDNDGHYISIEKRT